MGPDAERVDLEPSTLKSNPGRLADEAASMSLFGSARHIRISGAGDDCAEAFTLLLDAERAGNPVVAIAPSLKATSKAVKLALGAPRAMSFACYLPEGAAMRRSSRPRSPASRACAPPATPQRGWQTPLAVTGR